MPIVSAAHQGKAPAVWAAPAASNNKNAQATKAILMGHLVLRKWPELRTASVVLCQSLLRENDLTLRTAFSAHWPPASKLYGRRSRSVGRGRLQLQGSAFWCAACDSLSCKPEWLRAAGEGLQRSPVANVGRQDTNGQKCGHASHACCRSGGQSRSTKPDAGRRQGRPRTSGELRLCFTKSCRLVEKGLIAVIVETPSAAKSYPATCLVSSEECLHDVESTAVRFSNQRGLRDTI